MPDYQPDYNRAEGAATTWQRSLHVECDNPYGGTPRIRFDEERRVVMTDGTTTGIPLGSVSQAFTDPSASYPLLDPATGAPLGMDVTHGQLYAMLWSLYMALATARDEAIALAAQMEIEAGEAAE